MNLPFSAINLWAVLVAAIGNMILGGLWYSPLLLGKAWMAAMGTTPEEIAEKKAAATRGYAVSSVGSIIKALVLALLISMVGANAAVAGLVLGIIAAIGLIATTHAANYAFEDRSLRLYLINVGYPVVSCAVMGAILGSWQ